MLAPAGRPGDAGEPGEVRANVFQAFEDKPMNFDAWDIDIYYQEKVAEIRRRCRRPSSKRPARCAAASASSGATAAPRSPSA